ncbi:hypothetical protein Rrhod_0671 [Rhodococcus rhodnii LMG 5362]|uniref:Uncharacterized protein n=1 Tax=Rhodococcus rhodnii LMG 5362 TaxID=1273125 RepID=R7WRN7_9NOCA|nr:hypothetical protein Rrhod_0671 [Rhodococcus rhodnii LMG 5362]
MFATERTRRSGHDRRLSIVAGFVFSAPFVPVRALLR